MRRKNSIQAASTTQSSTPRRLSTTRANTSTTTTNTNTTKAEVLVRVLVMVLALVLALARELSMPEMSTMVALTSTI
ncbi:hypothetical protein E3P78_04177 [Wallemia ichthyophaga]|nr:hypothetical protein E3P78_04177 [Wallemia ichthyophaga]